MAIQSITSKSHNIYGVYGFGSFFRDDQYNDVDILIVASPECRDTLSLFYSVREQLQIVDENLNIDLTLLTYSEFLTKPLLESNSLTEIYVNSNNCSINASCQLENKTARTSIRP
jgi:predicted nucleotidyltransferase